jgi:iron complex transport system permease protein
VALLLLIVWSCGQGALYISFPEMYNALIEKQKSGGLDISSVLLDIRLPRILGAVAIGALLAISGVIFQSVLRNDLADSSIVGTSSGAMLASAIFITGASRLFPSFNTDSWMQAAFAFIGAVGILKFSSNGRNVSNSSLILTGIAFGSLAGAITGVLIFVSNESQLRTLTFWTMGSLAGLNLGTVSILLLIVLFTISIAYYYSHQMDLLSLGEDDAFLMGVNVRRIKLVLLTAASLAVAVAVSFTGIIGFVGLVTPHIARLLLGYGHKKLIITASVFGSLLLLFADTISRIIVLPAELPVGIVTSIIGVPFFISLIYKNQKLAS